MNEQWDVVVVGSGPNGLAAALTIARAGLQVLVLESQSQPGGGARTLDLGLSQNMEHDICSAVHPLALASPFFRALNLQNLGVKLLTPEASYAQPLINEPSAIAWMDLGRTAQGLGADGRAWTKMFSPLIRDRETLLELALGDKRSLPLDKMGLNFLETSLKFLETVTRQGTFLWDSPLRTERGRALLTGVAAHASGKLPSLGGAGTAMLLATLGHIYGWPIPEGGSREITAAMVRDLRRHGGRVETEVEISSASQIPPSRVLMLDTSASAAADILAGRISSSMASMLHHFPHGGGAAKVDLVLREGIPWRDAEVGRAGTQHLGGTRAEMAHSERDVAMGRTPEKPMILVSDPAVVDSSRIHAGNRPVWAYAHVAYNDPRDPTELVLSRLEEFAPGVRDLVVASSGISAHDMKEHNPSLVGGDIGLGKISMRHMVARPTPMLDPYRLAREVYLCSAATPPGPGVHGMSGWNAAKRVLRQHFGISATLSVRGEPCMNFSGLGK